MFPIKDNVPTRSFPIVTLLLIVTNVAVWIFYELPNLDRAVIELAYHPCEVDRSCPVVGEDWPITAVTSMFMHGDWLHLIGNMLFLWIFGNNVEDALGHVRYLVFYFLGGFAATAVQTFVTLSVGTPAGGSDPEPRCERRGLGGARRLSACSCRTRSVVTVIWVIIIFIREFPAWLFLGFWFIFQLVLGGMALFVPEEGGGVAFFAHIGGFVFGALAVRFFVKRRPLQPAY